MAKKRTAARKRAKTITSRAGNRLRGRTVAVGGYRATRYRANPQGGIHRDDDGKLPAYAWPGGYPIIYVTADGAVLCPDCANRKNGSLASTAPRTSPDWRIVGQSIHYEGPPEYCAHCNDEIPSAYGDPDDPNENPRGRRRGARGNPNAGVLRSYGPGKYDTLVDAYVHGELGQQGYDEEVGDVALGAWYGMIRAATGHGRTARGVLSASPAAGLNRDEMAFLDRQVGCIVREDDQGFVSVDYYTNLRELNSAWRQIEASFDDAEYEDEYE